MFEYILLVSSILTKVLTSVGLQITQIKCTSVHHVTVFFTNSDEYCFELSVGEYADEHNSAAVTYAKGPNTTDTKEVCSFLFRKDYLTTEEMCNVFKAFIQDEPLEVNKKSYFFTKKCGRCANIFYRKEIIKDAFENLLDNENIETSIVGKEYTAQITSVCSMCS